MDLSGEQRGSLYALGRDGVGYGWLALLVWATGCGGRSTAVSPHASVTTTLQLLLSPKAPDVQLPRARLSQSYPFKLKYETRTLANGLRVIFLPDQTASSISYQTWIRVGSVDEHPGTTGLSHLFEYLLFSGTASHPAPEFAQALNGVGADINAYSTYDYTVFYDNIPPEFLNQTIELEADRFIHASWSAEHIQQAKVAALEERQNHIENNLELKLNEVLTRIAYHSHPYSWPVLGFPEEVVKLQLEDIQNHYRKYYVPENMTLVLAGRLHAGEVILRLERAYADLGRDLAEASASSTPSEPSNWLQRLFKRRILRSLPARDASLEAPQCEERRLTLRDPSKGRHFMMGFHISSADSRDSAPLDVLSWLLIEGRQARLMQPMSASATSSLPLFANLQGSSYTPTFPGLFVIGATLRTDVTQKQAEDLINREIALIQTQGVSTAEVNRVVKQLQVRILEGRAYAAGSRTALWSFPDDFQ